jgi:ribosomal-protein-alanine N-acetyltransferase
MTVTIEPLSSPADLEGVLAVERASFTNPWTREMYEAELRNPDVSAVFVARDGAQQIVGFCSFWHVLDELHINNLAVLPDYRRQGIGSALLRQVLARGEALETRRAVLEVRRSNEIARRTYERFGFTVAGIRRDYYCQPVEDALVLWREANGPPPGRLSG